MKMTSMRVGSDYMYSSERDWLATGGQRVRLVYGERVDEGNPSATGETGLRTRHGEKIVHLPVVIDGQHVPGFHRKSRYRMGDGRALVADVLPDGTLGKPKAVHLAHIRDDWAKASTASDAYRAAMEAADREQIDRQKRLNDDISSALGYEVALAIAPDDTVKVNIKILRELLQAVMEDGG